MVGAAVPSKPGRGLQRRNPIADALLVLGLGDAPTAASAVAEGARDLQVRGHEEQIGLPWVQSARRVG